MGDSFEAIKHLKLYELSLPSAHNSGMDSKASVSDMWRTCQNDSFRYQLDNGIRVLDIRLRYYWGVKEGHGKKYWHRHDLDSGRTLDDTLVAIKEFLEKNPDEFLIVDIHDFDAAFGRDIPYQELADYIYGMLNEKLLPADAAELTLAQLKKSYPGKTVVIAATHELALEKWVWPKIGHQWIGQQIVKADELGRFIDKVMESPPTGKLWSMSATGYGVIGPAYIEEHIDSWYRECSPYQMKSNIINVDWFDRTRLVKNCIETNIKKGLQRSN
ncbi:hypothetical protein SB766_19005 [Pseudomonas sp. SIMBA_077]